MSIQKHMITAVRYKIIFISNFQLKEASLLHTELLIQL